MLDSLGASRLLDNFYMQKCIFTQFFAFSGGLRHGWGWGHWPFFRTKGRGRGHWTRHPRSIPANSDPQYLQLPHERDFRYGAKRIHRLEHSGTFRGSASNPTSAFANVSLRGFNWQAVPGATFENGQLVQPECLSNFLLCLLLLWHHLGNHDISTSKFCPKFHFHMPSLLWNSFCCVAYLQYFDIPSLVYQTFLTMTYLPYFI